MSKCKLVCMGFDGQIQRERPEFDTAEEAWGYSNDMGSKWFFYPFHFLTSASGKTIVGTPENLECFNGKRLGTVMRAFEKCSKLPEAENMEVEAFLWLLHDKNSFT